MNGPNAHTEEQQDQQPAEGTERMESVTEDELLARARKVASDRIREKTGKEVKISLRSIKRTMGKAKDWSIKATKDAAKWFEKNTESIVYNSMIAGCSTMILGVLFSLIWPTAVTLATSMWALGAIIFVVPLLTAVIYWMVKFSIAIVKAIVTGIRKAVKSKKDMKAMLQNETARVAEELRQSLKVKPAAAGQPAF